MTAPYKALNDAAENPAVDGSVQALLAPGRTEIWYVRQVSDTAHGRDTEAQYGVDFFQAQGNDLPLPREVAKDGLWVLLGTVAGTDPEALWMALQGESWSPRGEARALLRRKGLAHTSMHVGDIVVVGGRGHMVDGIGFVRLPTSAAEQARMREAATEKHGEQMERFRERREGVGMRGLLRRMEEAKDRKVKVTAFLSLRTGFVSTKEIVLRPGQGRAFKAWLEDLKGDPQLERIELGVGGKDVRVSEVLAMLEPDGAGARGGAEA